MWAVFDYRGLFYIPIWTVFNSNARQCAYQIHQRYPNSEMQMNMMDSNLRRYMLFFSCNLNPINEQNHLWFVLVVLYLTLPTIFLNLKVTINVFKNSSFWCFFKWRTRKYIPIQSIYCKTYKSFTRVPQF